MELLDNIYIRTVVVIFIVLYASKVGPNLPNFIRNLFNNALFRVAILFFILVRANKDPKMSIFIAIGFILTLNYLAETETKETFGEMSINSNEIKEEIKEETKEEEDKKTEEERKIKSLLLGKMTCGL
jgi:hypothetical protein